MCSHFPLTDCIAGLSAAGRQSRQSDCIFLCHFTLFSASLPQAMTPSSQLRWLWSVQSDNNSFVSIGHRAAYRLFLDLNAVVLQTRNCKQNNAMPHVERCCSSKYGEVVLGFDWWKRNSLQDSHWTFSVPRLRKKGFNYLPNRFSTSTLHYTRNVEIFQPIDEVVNRNTLTTYGVVSIDTNRSFAYQIYTVRTKSVK